MELSTTFEELNEGQREIIVKLYDVAKIWPENARYASGFDERRAKALALNLELVKAHLEPGRVLNHLNETSLTEDQAMIRLDEMAEGQKGVSK